MAKLLLSYPRLPAFCGAGRDADAGGKKSEIEHQIGQREEDRSKLKDYAAEALAILDGLLLDVARYSKEHLCLLLDHSLAKRRSTFDADFDEVIAASEAMFTNVLEVVAQFAPLSKNVLITGDTGTGKGMVAEVLHNNSSRRNGPYVHQNMAALPPSNMMRELFGHKGRVFTHVEESGKGLFLGADGGTLFLDEIGKTDHSVQNALLTVVEDGRIRPVGADPDEVFKVDVRVISGASEDLRQEIQKRTFPKDLYFRLAQLRVHLPALKDRREDIPILVGHLIAQFEQEEAVSPSSFDAEAMETLLSHDWPGNIRELDDVVGTALATGKTKACDLKALMKSICLDGSQADPGERAHWQALAKKHNNDKRAMAAEEGVSIPTVYRKLKDLGIPARGQGA